MENRKDPTSGEWIRTFAIITTDANEMVAEIHDRMLESGQQAEETALKLAAADRRDITHFFKNNLTSSKKR